MSALKKPVAAGQMLDEYLVIGHLDDLSVVQSPEGIRYYAGLDVMQQPAGTYIDRSLLRPVTELPPEIQYRINHEF